LGLHDVSRPYAWRLTKESRQMSAALRRRPRCARAETACARRAGGSRRARARHAPVDDRRRPGAENEIGPDSSLREDIALLKTQAQRCRDILQKLTKHPSEQDPLHARVSVRAMLEEAAAPYRSGRIAITIAARAAGDGSGARLPEAVVERRPGVIYGLGNIIENATDRVPKVEINASERGRARDHRRRRPGLPQKSWTASGSPTSRCGGGGPRG
jgi:two-component system sensor histidine kinase RegB